MGRLGLSRSYGRYGPLPRYKQPAANIPTFKRDAALLRRLATSEPEVLGWLKKAAKSNSHLSRMVHEHTVNAKPLSYCIGHQPFNALSLAIVPPILIPRPETEAWTSDLSRELAFQLIGRSTRFNILEVGSGSGCIALHLAASLPSESAVIYSIDYSAQAVALSQKNAQRNKHLLLNPVSFHQMDLFDSSLPKQLLALLPRSDKFDLIVSNPPYISPNEYLELDKSVKEWEDKAALVGSQENADGLEYYRRIAELCGTLLKGEEGLPKVVLEVGWKQADQVKEIFQHLGTISVDKDVFGVDRVVKVY